MENRYIIYFFIVLVVLVVLGQIFISNESDRDDPQNMPRISHVVGFVNCGGQYVQMVYQDRVARVHLMVVFHGDKIRDTHGQIYVVPEMGDFSCKPIEYYKIS